MALETMAGVLVAVAVPAWLVVEQVMKWQVMKGRRWQAESLSPFVPTSPVRMDNSTGPALRRKAA